MISYSFEILTTVQMKGHKIEKTRDYEVKVLVRKDEKTIFNDVVKVRKNVQGVYPDTGLINKKIKSAATKKELLDKLKTYVKNAR
jgi:hypothetical protein